MVVSLRQKRSRTSAANEEETLKSIKGRPLKQQKQEEEESQEDYEESQESQEDDDEYQEDEDNDEEDEEDLDEEEQDEDLDEEEDQVSDASSEIKETSRRRRSTRQQRPTEHAEDIEDEEDGDENDSKRRSPAAVTTADPAAVALSMKDETAANAWVCMKRLINLALIVGMLQPPKVVKKGQKYKQGDVQLNLPKLEQQAAVSVAENFMLIAEPQPSGRHQCPVPGCTRDFKVFASLKYHVAHADHDVLVLFEHTFWNEQLKERSHELSASLSIDIPTNSEEVLQLYRLFSHHGTMRQLLSQETPSWMPSMPRWVQFSFRFTLQDPLFLQQQQQLEMKTMLPQPVLLASSSAGNIGSTSNYQAMLKRRREKAAFNPLRPIPQLPTTPRPYDFLFPQAQPTTRLFQPVSAPIDPQVGQTVQVQHHMRGQSEASYGLRPLECKRFDDVLRKKGFVLNAGEPVWITEWVPGIPMHQPQYLLVGGGVKETPSEGEIVTEGGRGCLQLWRFPPLRSLTQTSTPSASAAATTPMDSDEEAEAEADAAEREEVSSAQHQRMPLTGGEDPVLELLLMHDYGSACRAEWCPSGAYVEPTAAAAHSPILPRLGLVAITFSDGSLRVFTIPHPMALKQAFSPTSPSTPTSPASKEPLWVQIKSIWTASLPDTQIISFAWSAQRFHRFMVAGSANGYLSVWDMQVALSGNVAVQNALLQLAPAHDAAVRSVAWYDVDHEEGQQYFVSTGNDGRLMLWDVQNLFDGVQLAKTHATIVDSVWSRSYQAVVWAGPDHMVRWSFNDALKNSMIAVIHDAGINSIHASPYHAFLATASADSSVQITNLLRMGNRGQRNIQITLYRITEPLLASADPNNSNDTSIDSMDVDGASSTVAFEEDVIPLEISAAKNDLNYAQFKDPWRHQHTARWHPTPELSTWVASGGRSGLVRVENTVAGYDRLRAKAIKLANKNRHLTRA